MKKNTLKSNINYRWQILFILFLVFASRSFSQDENYQGALIYHFANLFQWPPANNYTIGVLGYSPIENVLVQISQTKKVGNSTITIKKCSSVNSITGCNIVFVCNDQLGELTNVVSNARQEKILIITASPGMAGKGAGINFIKQEGKVMYEVNPRNINATGLEVPDVITKMAKIVY
jgi:hypothetical protein